MQQFLSTNANLRSDEYGGSIENRARFLFEVLEAMIAAVGPERVGVKFSPQIQFNDVEETDAEVLYPYILEALNDRNIALRPRRRLHGRSACEVARRIQRRLLCRRGFTKESGDALLEQRGADAIVYGTKLLANPDLPERFRRNASLNEPDRSTFYVPGEHGYTDYPTLEEAGLTAT